MVDSILRDVRYALRGLRRSPGFTAVAVLTLALGIGATTAIFSVVYGLLFRPLPYRDSGRLVVIDAYRTFAGRPATRWNYSYPDLEDWRVRSQSFESIALSGRWSAAVSGDGQSEQVGIAAVSDGFFSTARGPLMLGRPLVLADERSPVAVISEQLWARHYARSPAIIGTDITLDAHPYTIVGVVPAAFDLPDARTDVWVPIVFLNNGTGEPFRRGYGGFNPIARLLPGVTLQQAQADADRVARQLAIAYPDVHGGVTATVVGLRASVVNAVRPAVLILFAAVCLLLVIACANVANLLLSRAVSRAREMAIRKALGASGARLVGQSLIDAAILAIGGCAAGTVVAVWSVRVLGWLEPPALPRLDAVRVDTPILLFAAALGTMTVLVAGLLPAVEENRSEAPLRMGAQSLAHGRRGQRVRHTLVVAQLALSVLLLVGAGLLGRSLVRLLTTDMGVASDHVAAILMDVRGGRPLTPPETKALLDRVIERIRSTPGVESAALTFSLPPNRTRFRASFELVDPATGRPAEYLVDAVPVTPGFFSTVRMTLVRGRLFTDADVAGTQPVMIASAAMARRFFGNADPVGHTLPVGEIGADGRPGDVTIVGIVGDVRYLGLGIPPASTIYLPYAQRLLPDPFVIARTTGDPRIATVTMRQAIAAVDPAISIVAEQTLDGLVSSATAEPRFRTVLLSVIAGLALVLATIGLYGVIAYSVTQRTSEIGVRMAVGATAGDVAMMVMREGAVLTVSGLAIGLGCAAALSGVLTTFLYGVTPTDALSFVLAGAGMLAVAMLATYLPARRATGVDPLVALRME